MNNNSNLLKIISWIFGAAVFAIGVLNIFYGNDTAFGIFLVLLSVAYFLPVNIILRKIMGFSIPRLGILKIVLGLFILWASLGVGELFNKIELMRMDL